MAIASFVDDKIQEFFYTGKIPPKAGWRSVHSIARRKLDMLHYSHVLLDLRSPPGNRLEELKGNLKGFYSIRINDQWRIIFQWTSQGPTEVDIVDYH
jgi:proteic killer suppression protein